ncbi:MAG: hypothetical protein U9N86_12615, partial [Bacteroidota bacterium]|nr:hypothetical protein [Bacteroidota bacterium]
MASTFRNKYRIDSHRMPEWDYSGNGLYFITLVTKERQCFFGRIDNVVMDLNQYGLIAQNEWSMSSIIRDEIVLWEFVVMPNHIHGIVQISVPDHDPLRVVETHGRDHLHVETHGRDHLHVETHGRDHLHVETHGRDHLHVETHGRETLQKPPK